MEKDGRSPTAGPGTGVGAHASIRDNTGPKLRWERWPDAANLPLQKLFAFTPGLPKLNFHVMRLIMATQAQSMGSVKDIQARLRHAKADTTANEYMQELPESVKKMVGGAYTMLKEGAPQQALPQVPQQALKRCRKKLQIYRAGQSIGA